jgi:plasmid stabilization system protein ParE
MSEIKIKWTKSASKEIENIFNFLTNESQSNKIPLDFIKSIFQRTEQLTIMLLSGQIEPNLKDYYVRYILFSNYKILYKYQNETIIITDIFHTKRNPLQMKNK